MVGRMAFSVTLACVCKADLRAILFRTPRAKTLVPARESKDWTVNVDIFSNGSPLCSKMSIQARSGSTRRGCWRVNQVFDLKKKITEAEGFVELASCPANLCASPTCIGMHGSSVITSSHAWLVIFGKNNASPRGSKGPGSLAISQPDRGV